MTSTEQRLRFLVEALRDEQGLRLSSRLAGELERAEDALCELGASARLDDEEYTRKVFESHVGATAGASDEDCGSCSCVVMCRYSGETL